MPAPARLAAAEIVIGACGLAAPPGARRSSTSGAAWSSSARSAPRETEERPIEREAESISELRTSAGKRSAAEYRGRAKSDLDKWENAWSG